MFCYLERKSSGAFSFIVIFALKLEKIQPKPNYKTDRACDVTNQAKKMLRKEKINESHVINIA